MERNLKDFGINSFVFLDLETSHLCSYDRPTIIEISLIAIHRVALLHPDVVSSIKRAQIQEGSVFDHTLLTFPRVADKLTLCLDPRKHTSPETYQLTKLDNLNLQESKKRPFDDGVSSILNLFLLRQEGPICLVAHNGNRFDFPLLKTELSRLGQEHPFHNLYCVDSVEAFRADFGYSPECTAFSDIPRVLHKRKAPNDGAGKGEGDEVVQDKEAFHHQTNGTSLVMDGLKVMVRSNDDGVVSCNEHITTHEGGDVAAALVSRMSLEQLPPTKSGDIPELQDGSHLREEGGIVTETENIDNSVKKNLPVPFAEIDMTCENVQTTNSTCDILEFKPSTPSALAKKRHSGSYGTPPSGIQVLPYLAPEGTSQQSEARKSPPPPPLKVGRNPHHPSPYSDSRTAKVSNSLINIFKRTYGVEPPNSHAAEDDIVSLIKVLLPRVPKFVLWADKNAKEFNSVGLYYKPLKPKRQLQF